MRRSGARRTRGRPPSSTPNREHGDQERLGHRVPCAERVRASCGQTTLILPNPNLEPETIRTGDSWCEQLFSEHYRVMSNVYTSHVRRLIGQDAVNTQRTADIPESRMPPMLEESRPNSKGNGTPVSPVESERGTAGPRSLATDQPMVNSDELGARYRFIERNQLLLNILDALNPHVLFRRLKCALMVTSFVQASVDRLSSELFMQRSPMFVDRDSETLATLVHGSTCSNSSQIVVIRQSFLALRYCS